MKLKKGISLLLILTMTLSFMSFAFTVAAAADTANIEIVADKDTAGLTVGDTFIANVNLTDISAKKLMGIQFTLKFDPTVLQVVDSKGATPKVIGQGTVPCKDIYSEATGEGFFSVLPSTIDNTAGEVFYALGKNLALVSDATACVDCPSGSYNVVGIRFKVLREGVTGLSFNMGDVKAYCSALTEKATVTDVTDTIRIGIVKQNMDSVAAIADHEVAIGTSLEDVIAQLPAKADVTFDDATTGKIDITWACDSYKGDVAGDYTFEGTLKTSETITNSKNLKATAKVTVKKLDIDSVAAAASVLVPAEATVDQIKSLLPATVSVTLKNGHKVDLPVTWTYTEGAASAEGELDLGTKYENTKGLKASCPVEISKMPATSVVATLVDGSVPASLTVAYEDADKDEAGIIARLPKVVTLQADSDKIAAFVTWGGIDYDGTKAGTYEFKGTITLPKNVTMEDNTVTVKVIISKAVNPVVKTVNYTFEDQKVKASNSLLTSLYPSKVAVVYEDGTEGEEKVVWDAASLALKASKAGTYTLNGTVGTVAVTAKVTVEGSVTPDTQSVSIYLNGQTVNGMTKGMLTGQAIQVTASEIVTWFTTNSSIAMITKEGRIIANAPGSVTITATDSTGATGWFFITVTTDPSMLAQVVGGNSQNDSVEIVFTDLGDYAWAAGMISKLAAEKVISGKTSTLYAPGDDVTRAEFASLLVRALSLTTSEAGKTFTDVSNGEWFYESVRIASALNIVSGYEDGSFNPNARITREEMAVMAHRAAIAANVSVPAKTSVSFSDAAQISGYAQESVQVLASAQIINGMGDGRFAPQETANRAQAAVIIYNLKALK